MQKNYNLLTVTVILLTTIFTVGTTPTPIKAISSSPSPFPSASISEESVTDNLKERLKANISEVSTDTKAPEAYSFVGVVQDIIQQTIVVNTKDGKKNVQINDETTLIRSPGNTSIKIENVRIGDYMIAIGDRKDPDTLIGKRIVTSVSAITAPPKTSGFGTIQKISSSSITLLTTNEEKIILTLNSDTVTKNVLGILKYTDLAVDQTIIYTADTNGTKSTATAIMIISK